MKAGALAMVIIIAVAIIVLLAAIVSPLIQANSMTTRGFPSGQGRSMGEMCASMFALPLLLPLARAGIAVLKFVLRLL